jgi:hypothetical protein
MGRQGGEGKIGCILWILAAFICGMVAFKMIPVKIQTAELYDFMIEQAKWAGNLKADALKKNILSKAQELNLPVTEKGVMVQKDRDRVRMEVVYTVPIEFPGYTYYWKFQHLVDRNIYVF